MIQPYEVRLRNLVSISDTPCAVRAIYEDGQVQLEYIYNSSGEVKTSLVIARTFEGIPITMDWLFRLGFKPNPYMPWLMENGALMCNTGNHWIWHWSGRVIKDIKYVHELQNVMFALSGREFEIKP